MFCDFMTLEPKRRTVVWQRTFKAALISASMSYLGCASAVADTNELTAQVVFFQLGDQRTELQRDAFFKERAHGKQVRWPMRVTRVKKGWWNYGVRGSVGEDKEVLCKVPINDANAPIVSALSIGDRVTCAGQISSYVRLLGISIALTEAKIE